MSQTLHQHLVQLRDQAEAWLETGRAEGFDPRYGICDHLTLNPLNRDRLLELMAQWPGRSGDAGYPVSHPAMRPEEAFTYATPEEMWRPEHEYARNRWTLLEWLIEQTEIEATHAAASGK